MTAPLHAAVYGFEDYAGVIAGPHSFYYGYEETEGDDWCFTYRRDGEVLLRLTSTELAQRGDDKWDCTLMLLRGIAQWLVRS